MIKKEYIQPNIVVVAVNNESLLQGGSPTGRGISNTEATGDALARENAFIFEEEEIE